MTNTKNIMCFFINKQILCKLRMSNQDENPIEKVTFLCQAANRRVPMSSWKTIKLFTLSGRHWGWSGMALIAVTKSGGRVCLMQHRAPPSTCGQADQIEVANATQFYDASFGGPQVCTYIHGLKSELGLRQGTGFMTRESWAHYRRYLVPYDRNSCYRC